MQQLAALRLRMKFAPLTGPSPSSQELAVKGRYKSLIIKTQSDVFGIC
jgi:hypothetical protein